MADDHESLDPGAPFVAHLLAGALAGTSEHCAMYPIDTLKTRMQAAECLTLEPGAPAALRGPASNGAASSSSSSLYQQAARSAQQASSSAVKPPAPSCNVCVTPAAPRPAPPSTMQVLRTALRTEGFRGLYKGFGAAVAGAGPAHALHFATYEYVRTLTTPSGHTDSSGSGLGLAVGTGLAAAVATVLNDAVMTPADTIKQRMQVASSPYRSSLDCLAAVLRSEGPAALYRGYQTALFMNVPFTTIHFAAYEVAKAALGPLGWKEEGHANHLLAGAVAGGAAAALTTPFDVVKTRIQTEGLLQAPLSEVPAALTSTSTQRPPVPPSSSSSAPSSSSVRTAGASHGPTPISLNHARLVASASEASSSSSSSSSCGAVQERLSTQPLRALRQIAQREGWSALLKGLTPRVLFHMPSAAICWGTYEGFKEVFLPLFAGKDAAE